MQGLFYYNPSTHLAQCSWAGNYRNTPRITATILEVPPNHGAQNFLCSYLSLVHNCQWANQTLPRTRTYFSPQPSQETPSGYLRRLNPSFHQPHCKKLEFNATKPPKLYYHDHISYCLLSKNKKVMYYISWTKFQYTWIKCFMLRFFI